VTRFSELGGIDLGGRLVALEIAILLSFLALFRWSGEAFQGLHLK
jgi:hypothetical protein